MSDPAIGDIRGALVARSEQIKNEVAEKARIHGVGELGDQRDLAVAEGLNRMRAAIQALPLEDSRHEAERLENAIVHFGRLMARLDSEPVPPVVLPWNPMVLGLTGFTFLTIGSLTHATLGLHAAESLGLLGIAGLTYLGIAGAHRIRNAVTLFNTFSERQAALRGLSAAEDQLLRLKAHIQDMESLRSEDMDWIQSLGAVYDSEYAIARHALSIAKQ